MTIGFSMPMAGNWSGRQHTDEAARATVSGIDPFKQKPSADGILKLPSRLRRDLIVLVVIKLAMLALLVWFALLFQFRAPGWCGVAAVALLLAYEHSLVSPSDLRRLNAAFFTMNGIIATIFLAFVAADLWLRS